MIPVYFNITFRVFQGAARTERAIFLDRSQEMT